LAPSCFFSSSASAPLRRVLGRGGVGRRRRRLDREGDDRQIRRRLDFALARYRDGAAGRGVVGGGGQRGEAAGQGDEARDD
jgi:hypothetical protein